MSLYEGSMTSQRLYVYETVELELSLATPALDSSSDNIDEFTCPIRLLKGDFEAGIVHLRNRFEN